MSNPSMNNPRPFGRPSPPYDPQSGTHFPLADTRTIRMFWVKEIKADYLLCKDEFANDVCVAKPAAMRQSVYDDLTFEGASAAHVGEYAATEAATGLMTGLLSPYMVNEPVLAVRVPGGVRSSERTAETGNNQDPFQQAVDPVLTENDRLILWEALNYACPRAWTPPDGSVILVQNDSDADQERMAVLGIDDWLFDPSQEEAKYKSRASASCVVPEADTHDGKFVILAEPIADGKVGRAYASGICPVKIDVQSADDEYADIADAETGHLESGSSGSAQILKKESGTGEKWALVRVSNVSPFSLVVLANAVANFAYVDDDNVGTAYAEEWQLASDGKRGLVKFDSLLGVGCPIDSIIMDMPTDSSNWGINWDQGVPPGTASTTFDVELKRSIFLAPILEDFDITDTTDTDADALSTGTAIEFEILGLTGKVVITADASEHDPPSGAGADIDLAGTAPQVLVMSRDVSATALADWNGYDAIYGAIASITQAGQITEPGAGATGGTEWTLTGTPASARVYAIKDGVF